MVPRTWRALAVRTQGSAGVERTRPRQAAPNRLAARLGSGSATARRRSGPGPRPRRGTPDRTCTPTQSSSSTVPMASSDEGLRLQRLHLGAHVLLVISARGDARGGNTLRAALDVPLRLAYTGCPGFGGSRESAGVGTLVHGQAPASFTTGDNQPVPRNIEDQGRRPLRRCPLGHNGNLSGKTHMPPPRCYQAIRSGVIHSR